MCEMGDIVVAHEADVLRSEPGTGECSPHGSSSASRGTCPSAGGSEA